MIWRMPSVWSPHDPVLATRHEEFAEASRIGEERANDRVEQSMYRRAVGYKVIKHKIIKVGAEPAIVEYLEEFPPDVNLRNSCWPPGHRKWKEDEAPSDDPLGNFIAA